MYEYYYYRKRGLRNQTLLLRTSTAFQGSDRCITGEKNLHDRHRLRRRPPRKRTHPKRPVLRRQRHIHHRKPLQPQKPGTTDRILHRQHLPNELRRHDRTSVQGGCGSIKCPTKDFFEVAIIWKQEYNIPVKQSFIQKQQLNGDK